MLCVDSESSSTSQPDTFHEPTLLGSELPGSQAADTKTGSFESIRDFSPFQQSRWGLSEGQRSSEIVEATEDQLTISDVGRFASVDDLSSARDRRSLERRQCEARRRSHDNASTSRQSNETSRQRRNSRASASSGRQSETEESVQHVKLSQVSLLTPWSLDITTLLEI